MTSDFAHTNIADNGREWVIEFDVADFTLAELHVEVGDGFLTITGDREPVGPFELQEHLKESLRVPPDVDIDRAVARYASGTLEITLPKSPALQRVIPIAPRSTMLNSEATPC